MAKSTQNEIERKYDVDERAVMPPLAAIGEVEVVGAVDLDAFYYDTERGDLAAQRIVLRRRSGGGDEGWHIKSPAETGRTELHWPLAEDDEAADPAPTPDAATDPAPVPDPASTDAAPATIPDAVLAAVRVHIRDRPVEVIARLRTHRVITHLLNGKGVAVVEVADDTVSASDARTGILRIWREWEAELLPGAPRSPKKRDALLDSVEAVLVGAGATPAASVSKLATALGRETLGEAPAPVSLTRDSTAVEVVVAALGGIIADLKTLDPQVRENAHDSVHQLRTRLRRARSILAAYRVVLDRAATDPIRDQLRQLGAVLGEARDAEVMRERARVLVDRTDEAGDDVERDLVEAWDERYAAAHDRVVVAMSSEPYFRLLDALDDLVAGPPLADEAHYPVRTVVPAVLRAEIRRVLRAAAFAAGERDDLSRVPLLHATRKAAKRLRYAADAVTLPPAGVFGAKVRHISGAAEAVHDVLGEYNDSSLLQEHLLTTASGAHAFAFGVLYEKERHSAALTLTEYPATLAELKKVRGLVR
ncbi:CYTH and CHAD domain-containing protein [Marisediminicola senii]|uniref:CYTH and CHAD domain-containing protein n=1 Tax=Marisediminicola senii TaxID=2711233 RepID=UPI0013E9E3B8|nr:CYTH and CHAD domain-containing protein [Marisediminicola senii]